MSEPATSNPEVREVHGTRATSESPAGKKVVITEGERGIHLDLGGYTGMTVTPKEASHLAYKLLRLARRIEARTHD